jgi:hypothetical protein
MSESEEYQVWTEWQEWHLTPKGWQPGSYEDRHGEKKIIAAPNDRVATNRYWARGAPRLGVITKIHEDWAGDKAATKKLTKKHGRTPEKLAL